MSMFGSILTLLIGPKIAVPAPSILTEALQGIEVTNSDEGRSGFQLTFQIGRSGPQDLIDYSLLLNPLLKPFNRVILIVTFNFMPRVLMDGIITHQQLSPGGEPGSPTLTVTGEDVSVMMDQEEKCVEHPAQAEAVIAYKLIMSYAHYGMMPTVIPPPTIDIPVPVERTPVQQGTDLQYLNEMAGRYGYVFYVSPGPVPFTNIAYWGPPNRLGVPQRALTVDMGHETNVDSINFQYNALSPTVVYGQVQDRLTNKTVPAFALAGFRPPLATQPAWLVNQPNVRRTYLRQSGLNYLQFLARAQGMMEAASDCVTAEGALDALQYGDLLKARGLVGLRGVGYSYDGFWYVKSVTHTIRVGEYKQHFSLSREGVGSTTPVVIP